jgi:hypothetical protein
MSAKITDGIFRKRGNAFVPDNIMADELTASYKEGSTVLMRIHKPRNIEQHRLLFAVLRKVRENTDRWPNEEVLLKDLKKVTGLYTLRMNGFSGQVEEELESISFASMPQDQFNNWFRDKAVPALADVLEVTVEELMEEAEAVA